MLTYADALRAILHRTDFERGPRPPYAERTYRLARVEELLAQFDDPHRAYPTVHVAGTKGKGSTTAMIASMLRAAGYAVGMYTSPHLHTFRERIRIGERLISEQELIDLVERMTPVLERRPEVTVFEIITALGMLYFAEQQVDVAVFEVGLGGRLDATNVILPEVSAITSISYDHVNVLGHTLEAIATEKAGIIKQGVPVVSAPQKAEAMAVLECISSERLAPLKLVGRDWQFELLHLDEHGQDLRVWRADGDPLADYPALHIPLLGEYQVENACLAVAAADALRQRGLAIPAGAVERGLRQVDWPGRMEILGHAPLVMVDGAHNGDSMQRLLASVRRTLTYGRLHVVLGAGAGHRPGELVEIISSACDALYVTQSRHPHATALAEMTRLAEAACDQVVAKPSVASALEQALAAASSEDLVLVTGSLFVVAEAREAWQALRGGPPLPGDPPGVY